MGGKLRRDLGQPGELSGMLNKALALIGKVKSEGITQSQSMTNAVEEYLSQDSTVLRYIRSNVVVASHQSVLEFDNLFEAYREWCVRRTIEPVGRTVFGRELAKYRPDWKQKRVSSGRRYYYGLSIISRPLTVVSA
jgi:phage/plasmid-associated DNA primase